MATQYCIHGEENCNRCAMNEMEAPTIHLHLILDTSPSMDPRWPQTISGLNEYFDTLRKDQSTNGQPYKVTLTGFSKYVRIIYDNVELDSIPRFTEENLVPHGYGTALWDAVGSTVTKINTTDPVLVVVVTDGEENSSSEWNNQNVSTLMDEREKLGNYTYAYLGIAKEAWGNATSMGKGMHRNSQNRVASDYGASTYAAASTGTVSYSASMRSLRSSGAPITAMNVSNFWVGTTTATPNPEVETITIPAEEDPTVTSTTNAGVSTDGNH